MHHTRRLRLLCAALSFLMLLMLCPAAQGIGPVDPSRYDELEYALNSYSSYKPEDGSYRAHALKGWILLYKDCLRLAIKTKKPKDSLKEYMRKEADTFDDNHTLTLLEADFSRRHYFSTIRVYRQAMVGVEETADLMKSKKNIERKIAKSYKGWKKTSSPNLFCYDGRDMLEIQGTFLADDGGRIGIRNVYVVNCGIIYTTQLLCDVDALDELASLQNDAVPYFDWE